MKFAFHRGQSAFSEAIRLVTHSDFTHVELVFSDGMAFSARSERKRAVDIIPFDGSDGRWEFIEIPFGHLASLTFLSSGEATIRKWCESKCGEKYDWLDIMSFVVPSVHEDPQKLICSAACTMAVQQVGLFRSFDASKVSPAQLRVMAQVLAELG